MIFKNVLINGIGILCLREEAAINHVPESGEVEDCIQNCKSDVTRFERKRNGTYKCRKVSGFRHVVRDVCWDACLESSVNGEEKENEIDCFCDYCRNEPEAYLGFCVEPVKNKTIRSDQCEQLVCTGKAKYYGEFCRMTPETSDQFIEQLKIKTEKDKRRKMCRKQCKEGHEDRLKQGLFACVNRGLTTAVQDPCTLDCKEEKKAEDQTECFCNYCKQSVYHMHDFCQEPGNPGPKNENKCDELVCTGKLKYHGMLCRFPDKQ